jgi:hypothetical protein
MANRGNNQVVGNIGLHYVCFRLAKVGWNVMPTARNARGIDILIYSQDARRKRMPVVLEPEDAQRWIESGDQSLLRRVNSPKNNDEMLIQPVEPTPPPARAEEPPSRFG